MPSRTTENAPAASSALASCSSRSPSSPRPWTRNPPKACTDCGVRPEVAHHRDARRDQVLDVVRDPLAALELDRVRARFLHEPDGGVQRLGRRRLVGAEGQVRDHHRPAGSADDGGGERDQVIDGHRDRGVVAEDHVARRVADQQHRDPGLVEDPRGERVVGGEHRPLLAARLSGGDVPDRDPAGLLAAVERLGLAAGGMVMLTTSSKPPKSRGAPAGVPGHFDNRTPGAWEDTGCLVISLQRRRAHRDDRPPLPRAGAGSPRSPTGSCGTASSCTRRASATGRSAGRGARRADGVPHRVDVEVVHRVRDPAAARRGRAFARRPGRGVRARAGRLGQRGGRRRAADDQAPADDDGRVPDRRPVGRPAAGAAAR